MAPNRKQAKSGITDQNQTDPEFNAAINKAHNAQLEIDQEKNRHAKEMKELELGKIGMWIGDGKNAASSLAGFCIVVGAIGFFACLGVIAYKDKTEFWANAASISLGLTLTSLAYIFGKSAAK